jgi:hypothetical protein
VYVESGPQQLPDVENLHWRHKGYFPGRVEKLIGSTTAIWDVKQTPHGDWMMVEFLQELPGEGDNTAIVASYLLDLEGHEHWVVKEGSITGMSTYGWLEDGRLLWADEGGLSIAKVDGSDKVNLAISTPIDEVWLGADSIALALSGERLWRVDALADTWQEVTDIPPIFNLSVVNDGAAALFVSFDDSFSTAEYWYLPFAFGGTPKLAASGAFLGGHGGRAFAPYHMDHSPYWYTAYLEQKVFIDERDGSLVSAEDILPFVPSMDEHYEPSYSPDGKWVIMEMGSGEIYIAPVQDLQAVQNVGGDIFAWESDPAAVFIYHRGSGSIQKMTLPDGNTTTIVDELEDLQYERIILVGDRIFVKYLDIQGDWLSVYIKSYGLNGEWFGMLGFPDVSDWSWPGFNHLDSSRLVLRMTEFNPIEDYQCEYLDTIVTWDVIPEQD